MNDLAFYIRDGHFFVPTGLGVSPWNDRAQMGVGLAGLIVELLETMPSAVPMLTARLTIDILGAVPIAPMTPSLRILREGKRLQTVEAELHIDGRAWVRAAALRVRLGDSPERIVPPSRSFLTARPVRGMEWVELRRLDGDFHTPGPGACWVRINCAVIAGEAVSPLAVVAMAADFGSGIAPSVAMKEWNFANVDIGVHISRAPRGEWLLLDAVTDSAGNGIGVVHCRLGDRDGMIGMTHQTTFLERR